MALLLGALLATLVALTVGQEDNFCENVKVMENLDFGRIGGVWWLREHSGFIRKMVESIQCHVSNFYLGADGKTFNVLNDYLVLEETKFVHKRYSWNITDEDPAPNGHLTAQMKIAFIGNTQVPFQVLATDYDTYLLIAACSDSPQWLQRFKVSLLLTRKKSFSEEELKALNEANQGIIAELEASGLRRDDFILNGLKDCETVTFPDRFELSPPVVAAPAAKPAAKAAKPFAKRAA